MWLYVNVARAQSALAANEAAANLILLEVQLDNITIAESLNAYQFGRHYFVPLGELANLLTLQVRVQPEKGKASGFVLGEDRSFDLDVAKHQVLLGGKAESYDPALVRPMQDDIYVAIQLVQRWFPVKLLVDLSRLRLTVQALQPLPLQLRLQREKLATQLSGKSQAPPTAYPRLDLPYKLVDSPFVDQTVSATVDRNAGHTTTTLASTTYMTADLAGMEGSVYYSAGKNTGTPPDFRLTLARNDTQGKLLGPLGATSYAVGSIPTPGVVNLVRTNVTGNGIALSNMPLTRATSFDTQSFQGSLPPGWDVELYFNDALVGYQQSRADGKYSFPDQRLIFGKNEFRLVFHGPQGQVRVEKQEFLLDDSVVKPGQLLYNFATQVDDSRDQGLVSNGLQPPKQRTIMQLEYGLTKNISAVGGLMSVPVATSAVSERIANFGLRGFYSGYILTADVARSSPDNNATTRLGNGTMMSLGLNTNIAGFAMTANHIQTNNFVSDYFLPLDDPIRMTDKVRLDGGLTFGKDRVPVTFQVERDALRSGAQNLFFSGQATAFFGGTAVTNQFTGQSLAGTRGLTGSLQLSQNIADLAVRSQVAYNVLPTTSIASAALAADLSLGNGYLVNMGVNRVFQPSENRFTVNLNKSLGAYALRVGLTYSTLGEVSVGVQFFTALSKPPGGDLKFDALPVAGSGAVSAHVFLDKNLNGVFDAGDEPVRNANFTVNGSTHPVKTDANGYALLSRLAPKTDTDIALNPNSLEDPQWLQTVKGVRILPRPGKIADLEFPVVVTSDLDGQVYLTTKGTKRGVGDVQLELLDQTMNVVMRTKSASDGYYIFASVKPGSYLVRISPEQLHKLDLKGTEARKVTTKPDGSYLNSIDFFLVPVADLPAPAPATSPEAPAGAVDAKGAIGRRRQPSVEPVISGAVS